MQWQSQQEALLAQGAEDRPEPGEARGSQLWAGRQCLQAARQPYAAA